MLLGVLKCVVIYPDRKISDFPYPNRKMANKMKFLKFTFSLIILIAIIYLTYFIVLAQNLEWRQYNGDVDVRYWLIRPLIWLKVTAYVLFVIKSIFYNRQNNLGVFKLANIKQRVISNILDFICVGFIWLIIMLLGALILLPLYKIGLINPIYKQDYGYLDCFNYLFDIGWYIYAVTFLIYSITLEFLKQSTFGKMMNNCGLTTNSISKPKLFQIIIKNLLRFIPINELWLYVKGHTFNEAVSGTRIIFLEPHNQREYNNLTK